MSPTIKLLPQLVISEGSSYVIRASYDDTMSMLPDACVDTIYADPPFGTDSKRVDPRDRSMTYADNGLDDAWLNDLERFATSAKRVLKRTGNLFLHLDWHGVHEAKVFVLDKVFGREAYVGEIVWAYDWGARQKDRFSRKHDTILHYAACAGLHRFDVARVETVPYKAPELQMYRSKRLGKSDGAERIARGKPVTDVFSDINVLGTSSKERALNSYPTMKPAKLLRRIIAPTVASGSVIFDPFCGSGPIVDAAMTLECSFVANDVNVRAFEITRARAERAGAKFDVVER